MTDTNYIHELTPEENKSLDMAIEYIEAVAEALNNITVYVDLSEDNTYRIKSSDPYTCDKKFNSYIDAEKVCNILRASLALHTIRKLDAEEFKTLGVHK